MKSLILTYEERIFKESKINQKIFEVAKYGFIHSIVKKRNSPNRCLRLRHTITKQLMKMLLCIASCQRLKISTKFKRQYDCFMYVFAVTSSVFMHTR